MSKKFIVIVLANLILGSVQLAEAQQAKKVPRIGWLSVTSGRTPRHDAFRQGLRELGYVEGQNIAIESRFAEQKEDRLAEFAAELVRLKVDVIVALEPPAIRAAKKATGTIPIVMRSTDDPVDTGLIASLARPGGNITGLTSISTELSGKRLELLKEVVSRLSHVAALRNPTAPDAAVKWSEAEVAARSLGLKLQSLDVRSDDDLERAFQAATKGRAQALITLRNPVFVFNAKRIAELAVKNRLPVIYDDRNFVDDGGLMSYGANLADLYHRAATYVDKILKGRKPADLPVEQPMKFEFVINLKAAKQIGLTIPHEVLARADKVIK